MAAGPRAAKSPRAAKRPRPLPASEKPLETRPGTAPAGIPAAFSPEFFEQANQGPLEEAHERLNRDPANWNPIPWSLVLLGILVGLVFAVVNVYAALAAGIVVGASWYLIFFLGASLGWKPATINYVGGASTGTSQAVLAIAYVVPTLFLLSTLDGGRGYYDIDVLPSRYALAGFFLVGGLLGVLFFQAYRHLWIVRRPLQYPGAFETAGGLLGVAARRTAIDRARIRDQVVLAGIAAVITGFWVVLRDLRAFGPSDGRRAFLDDLFGGRYYEEGIMPALWESRPFYNGLVILDPFFAAIGWFVRMRIALILLLGAAVTWFLPFLDPSAHGHPAFPGYGFILVWSANARLLAAAAIVGAGIVALVRLSGAIREGMRQLIGAQPERPIAERKRALGVVVGLLFLAMLALLLAGLPVGAVLLIVPLAVVLIAILGFIAVKVTGETAVQPISPMITIGLLGLLLLLGVTGTSQNAMLILALGAAAFFGTGILMSTDLLIDTKIAHYVGTPAHRQGLVQAVALIPGILIGTLLVWVLSPGVLVPASMPPGTAAEFRAPFAHAFSGIASIVLGDQIPWLLVLLAFLLGASVEYGTRLGTAFGVGMALPLFVPVTIALGALGRETYERTARPGTTGARAEHAFGMRIMLPVGVFLGASLTAVVVFLLNQWVF